MTSWSFLSLELAMRQTVTAGDSHPDVLGSHYVYDSTVDNWARVAEGDLAVIRDATTVLGMGWIDQVTSVPARKVRLRCPVCGRTGFKRRKAMSPTYWCSRGQHAFDDPAAETINIMRVVADYSRSWRPVDHEIPIHVLEPAYRSKSPMQSIRELSASELPSMFSGAFEQGESIWPSFSLLRTELPGGHLTRLGKVRIGQQAFRKTLLRRYGSNCAFTGPQPEASLQAAHLYRYSDRPVHDSMGGLLLRADLHSLFDRWLIAVDPASWTIEVAPALRRYADLAKLNGTLLQLPIELRPSAEHLVAHLDICMRSWG